MVSAITLGTVLPFFPSDLFAASEQELERDLMRVAAVPVVGYLAQPALTNIQASGPRTPVFKSIPERRVRELLVSSYRARTLIERPSGAQLADPLLLTEGIPPRAEPRRWHDDVDVRVNRRLGIERRLQRAVYALSHAIGLMIRVDTFETRNSRADVVIDLFGYARVGHNLVTYDPRLSPIKSTFRQPPRINRQYCLSRSFEPEMMLRCVSFETMVKKYHARFGLERSFWTDAVVFTPNEWAHVDGFLAADANNEIYFAQCFVPLAQPIEVRTQLGLECLIRALGLPGGTEFAKPSALDTKIFLPDPERSRGRFDPYTVDVSTELWVSELAAGPSPTEYDLKMLRRLYATTDE